VTLHSQTTPPNVLMWLNTVSVQVKAALAAQAAALLNPPTGQ
jgi:hypothetical protein